MLDFNKSVLGVKSLYNHMKPSLFLATFLRQRVSILRRQTCVPQCICSVTWMIFTDKKHMTTILKQGLSCQSN